jgi:hypothetical protein
VAEAHCTAAYGVAENVVVAVGCSLWCCMYGAEGVGGQVAPAGEGGGSEREAVLGCMAWAGAAAAAVEAAVVVVGQAGLVEGVERACGTAWEGYAWAAWFPSALRGSR